MIYYFDTSAVVKYYAPEKGTDQTIEIIGNNLNSAFGAG